MQIIVIGDPHGTFNTGMLDSVNSNIDLALCTGDIMGVHPSLRKFQLENRDNISNLTNQGYKWNEALEILMGKEKLSELCKAEEKNWLNVLKIFSERLPLTLLVSGNVDGLELLNEALRNLDNVMLLDGRAHIVNDYAFIGIGDYFNPRFSKMEIDEFERRILEVMAENSGRKRIILSHYPPYGILDKIGNKNTGSHFVKTLIDKFSPEIVICGHIHEQKGKTKVGNTWVINAGSDGAITWIEYSGKENTIKIVP